VPRPPLDDKNDAATTLASWTRVVTTTRDGQAKTKDRSISLGPVVVGEERKRTRG